MEDQAEEEVADPDLVDDREDDRDDDLAEEDHMLRDQVDRIALHDQDLVVEKLLMVHLREQRDHRHLVQIDQPMLREHEVRDDDLVEREEEDRLDRIEDEREVVLDSEETEEVIGEDLGLDQIDEDLVMERVGADPGLDQIEVVRDHHLLSTKPEKLALRKLSSAISLHVVKQRDHKEETIGGRSRRNDE